MRASGQRPTVRGPARWLLAIGTVLSSGAASALGGATLDVPGSFPSIQAAHDAATSGDTILVAPGTYTGQITLTKAVTVASYQLTTGDPGYIDTTILDGDGGSFVIEISADAEDRPTVQGFTIQNAGDGIAPHAMFDLLHCRVWDTSDGVDYEDGSGGLVRSCLFEQNSDDGIDLDYAVDIVIEDSIIRDNGDDGIEIRMQNHVGPTLRIVIDRNAIHGNEEDGIQLIHYDVLTDRVFEITGNTIYDNVAAGIGMMDGGDTEEDFRAADIPETIYVFNNTFAGNSHGISGGDNTVVVDNIFVGHSVIAVKEVDAGSELAFNLYFGNGTDDSGSNVDVASSVYSDPFLTPDLELPAGSPAIDAGTATYVWQGATVLDLPPGAWSGAAPDLGAFEFDGGGGLPPDPPLLLAPADGAVDVGLTPTLSWTGDGDSFTVQIATDAAFTDVVESALVTTTQFTVSQGALDHLATYHWHVNAADAGGTSDYSPASSFTTEAAGAPPLPPTLLMPVDGASGVPLQAVLQWAGTAQTFDVQVASDAAFVDVVFSTSTASSTATLPTGPLLHETDYHWHVRGLNGFGAGAWSSTSLFTTVGPPDTSPPSPPQALWSPAQTGTTVDLLWDASTDDVGVSHYVIYRDGVPVASESSTNHSAVGLTPATTYGFQVTAVDDADNESGPSATLTVSTVDTIAPTAPGTPTLDAKSVSTVSFSWAAAVDNVAVTSYDVFLDGAVVDTVPASTLSHTESGLDAATPHAFHVTARDAAGNESPASGTLVAVTLAGPAPQVLVGGIDMELRAFGKWHTGRGVITVIDDDGHPIDGASVVAQWSGLANDLDAGLTSGGDVQFESDKVSDSQAGQFVITVVSVSVDGYEYDPASNVVTAGCIDTSGNSCPVGPPPPPDTEPPAAPEDLTATAGAGAVSLDWADSTEPDWAGYSVYRSTAPGVVGALVAEGLTSSHATDTGLTAGVTYHYVVTATDASGNESAPSNEASATPTEPPVFSVRVASIDVDIVRKGKNVFGRVSVSVVDQDGTPVSGVDVEGVWAWNASDIGSGGGLTDGDGIATHTSSKTKADAGDVIAFSVTDLTIAGYAYDPADNAETSDFATVP